MWLLKGGDAMTRTRKGERWLSAEKFTEKPCLRKRRDARFDTFAYGDVTIPRRKIKGR
jgi:hypothetical protein